MKLSYIEYICDEIERILHSGSTESTLLWYYYSYKPESIFGAMNINAKLKLIYRAEFINTKDLDVQFFSVSCASVNVAIPANSLA